MNSIPASNGYDTLLVYSALQIFTVYWHQITFTLVLSCTRPSFKNPDAIYILLTYLRLVVGLMENNGSPPPGLWLLSPAGWLPRNRDQLRIPSARNRVWDWFTFFTYASDSPFLSLLYLRCLETSIHYSHIGLVYGSTFRICPCRTAPGDAWSVSISLFTRNPVHSARYRSSGVFHPFDEWVKPTPEASIPLRPMTHIPPSPTCSSFSPPLLFPLSSAPLPLEVSP